MAQWPVQVWVIRITVYTTASLPARAATCCPHSAKKMGRPHWMDAGGETEHH